MVNKKVKPLCMPFTIYVKYYTVEAVGLNLVVRNGSNWLQSQAIYTPHPIGLHHNHYCLLPGALS